jgi:hypothetical protein
MQRAIEFKGDFDVVAKESLRPGGWYLGFACSGCGRHFAILDEPTNSGAVGLGGNAAFHVQCPNCGQANAYGVADLVIFESAQGGSISTS